MAKIGPHQGKTGRKINGVIDKNDLAEIFRRAEALLAEDPDRRRALDARRRRGRLGKALIQELLQRAVVGDPPTTEAPSAPKGSAAAPPGRKVRPRVAEEAARPSAEPTEEEAGRAPPPRTAPSEREARARRLIAQVEALTDPSEFETVELEGEPAPTAPAASAGDAARLPGDPHATDPTTSGARTATDEASPAVGEALPTAGDDRTQRALAETQNFLTLDELRESLCKAARRHLDEQAALRTFLEDLEMPDPIDEAEVEAARERVRSAEEISFEGTIEDIERLLLETYEHYRNMPEAFGPRRVDPSEEDLLGPSGDELSSRRAARRAGQVSGRLPRSLDAGSPTPPAPAGPFPAAGPSPGLAGAPRPDPFAFSFPSAPPPAAGASSPGGWTPSPADPGNPPGPGGASVDPFALDPYTCQPLQQAIRDPFAVDPFAPFANARDATTGRPPVAPTAPAPSGPSGPGAPPPFHAEPPPAGPWPSRSEA
ncbi:MAG: hypothetical protein D6731_17535, partial [Planctomycetota bacterium]